MIEIDPSQFAPEIANILMTRGAATPPLHWPSAANQIARRALNELPDEKLFGKPSLVNPNLAKAVRSLLCLWTGWTEDCQKFAQAAPPKEQLYLAALAERHNGEFEQSKIYLRDLDAYATHRFLTEYAVKALAPATDPTLTRFQKMLELDSRWEAFLFTDLFQQAQSGKLKNSSVEIICRIQCFEFEQILRFWYEQATGDKLSAPKRQESSSDHLANMKRTRKLADKHQAKRAKPAKTPEKKNPSAQQDKGDSAAGGSAPSTAQPAGVTVACPKCKKTLTMPESARGTKQACNGCGAIFLIPAKRPDTPPTQSTMPANVIGIRCPRCQATVSVPETSRGGKERCAKCGAVFLVPGKPTPQPAATGT